MNGKKLTDNNLPADYGPKHPLWKSPSCRNRYYRILSEESAGLDVSLDTQTFKYAAGSRFGIPPNLRACSRIGIDVIRRCNFACKTCFYRWGPEFNTSDEILDDVLALTRAGRDRGCDHVVLIGKGEPGLWKPIFEFISEVKNIGMTSSIITNGSMPVTHYAKMREAGLNHLHVSVHGLGDTLDKIVCHYGAGAKQAELMTWLKKEDWPWRMNMTCQLLNYKEMPDIAIRCIENGCRHIISLGFLPHYEWGTQDKIKQVAVDPRELSPYIECVHAIVSEHSEVLFTVRYHPMCLLAESVRKYVVNASYVLYDPWEWDYGHCGESSELLWRHAREMGSGVGITEEPCRSCGLLMACGGWNKTYCAGFGRPKDILQSIEIPDANRYEPGWLHIQNPANLQKGWF